MRVSFVVVSWIALATACVTAQTTTLKPVLQFDIGTCLPGTPKPITHAFAVTSSALYFLVSPPSVSTQYLVKFDSSGRCLQTTTLPERVSPHLVTFDSGGQMIVLKRYSAQKVEKLVFDSKGSIASRATLDKPVFQIFPSGSEFVGASLNGDVNLYSENGQTIKTFLSGLPPGNASMYLAPVSAHLFLLIDARKGSGQLVDSASGAVKQLVVAPQEIAASLAVYSAADQSKATIISSAAGQGDGYVYLSLSGIRIADGALILKIDQSGNIVQRFRCTLPTRLEYATSGNPDGFMTPALLAVRTGHLYILDRKGSAAEYKLP